MATKITSHQARCIFCEISQGKTPCHKVWESATHLAFLSIYPNTEGLTVVIPKAHKDSYVFNQTEKDLLALMLAAQKVAAILVKKFPKVGRTAVVFEGYGVNHLHAKLIPLHGTARPWQPIKADITVKYSIYPGYISSHDAERASDTELSKLAKFLRENECTT